MLLPRRRQPPYHSPKAVVIPVHLRNDVADLDAKSPDLNGLLRQLQLDLIGLGLLSKYFQRARSYSEGMAHCLNCLPLALLCFLNDLLQPINRLFLKRYEMWKGLNKLLELLKRKLIFGCQLLDTGKLLKRHLAESMDAGLLLQAVQVVVVCFHAHMVVVSNEPS